MAIFLEDLRLNKKVFKLSNNYIRIQGEDAEQYLHSQTTNNVKSLEVKNFQFNSILDTSGKIISSFLIYKNDKNDFFLIVEADYIEATIERIEKYHIAEEFDVSAIDKDSFLVINDKSVSSSSKYFFDGDYIIFETDEKLATPEEFETLKLLTGVPTLGREVEVGTLINNTFFDELSVDYKKGCYPGQETVSKINTRRGAAYKPVLLICDSKAPLELGKIEINSKKVGEIKKSLSIGEQTFNYVDLLREYRVDKSDINFTINSKELNGRVHYLPFIDGSKEKLAIDLYDRAMEYFLANDNELALKYFTKAIEVNPTYEDAYESLGVLYGRLEQFDKAIELMKQLKELNPKCMMALTNLSLYHMKIGEIETAEKYKGDATLLNFELLGDEADRKRQKEEAEVKRLAEMNRREGMFKQVLEMDPEDAMANNGMGEIELDRQNFMQAQKYFDAAIKSDKKYSVAYLGLAKSLYQQQKIDELKDVLQEGIKIAGKNGDLMPANEMQSLYSKL